MEKCSIIVDSGTGYVKMGFSSSDKSPIKVKRKSSLNWWSPNYLGPSHYDVLKTTPLTSLGMKIYQRNADEEVEFLMQSIRLNLDVDAYRFPIVIVENETSSKSRREEMAEILFEKWHVPALYMAHEAAFSLSWYGYKTGVVVDCGHEISSIVTFDNYRRCADRVMAYGGFNTTHQIVQDFMQGSHNQFRPLTKVAFHTLEHMKMNMFFVASNFEREERRVGGKDYKMADATMIYRVLFENLDRHSYKSKLFDERYGIQHVIRTTIAETRTVSPLILYNRVFLCGGITTASEFHETMTKSLVDPFRSIDDINVFSKPGREFSAWYGAKEFACGDAFYDRQVLGIERYREDGVRSLFFSMDMGRPRWKNRQSMESW